MKFRSIFPIALFAVASAALAASHMEPSPLRKLDPLVGKFQCTGTAYASPMSPEHATVSTVETKWTLDGQWAMVNYMEKKTAANPKPMTFSGFFGYDSGSHEYVATGVDNIGGYSTSTSKGWDGQSITFAGEYHAGGMTMNGRDVFMKVSDTAVAHTFEIEQNGTWQKLAQDNCTRVK